MDMRSGSAIAQQWIGVLSGAVAWAIDLAASYAMVKWSCASHQVTALLLVSVGTLMLALTGVWLSWLIYRRLPADATADGGMPSDRSRFMALWGLAMSGWFFVVILVNVIPRVMLGPCP